MPDPVTTVFTLIVYSEMLFDTLALWIVYKISRLLGKNSPIILFGGAILGRLSFSLLVITSLPPSIPPAMFQRTIPFLIGSVFLLLALSQLERSLRKVIQH